MQLLPQTGMMSVLRKQTTEKIFCRSNQKEEKKMTGELIAASVCGLIVVSETIYCVMDLMKHSNNKDRR